jgi:hypothetical protein
VEFDGFETLVGSPEPTRVREKTQKLCVLSEPRMTGAGWGVIATGEDGLDSNALGTMATELLVPELSPDFSPLPLSCTFAVLERSGCQSDQFFRELEQFPIRLGAGPNLLKFLL